MARRRASGAQEPASMRVTCAPLRRRRPHCRFTHETLARAVDPPPHPWATHKPSRRRRDAGETHTYEADQDGDLNLQLTMVSFADAKAKKGETYVVYAAADDGAVACVYQTPWRNG